MPNHQQKHREVLNECEMNMIDFNEIKRIIAKGTVSVLCILEVKILSHRHRFLKDTPRQKEKEMKAYFFW